LLSKFRHDLMQVICFKSAE